jgi:hypothetical protein
MSVYDPVCSQDRLEFTLSDCSAQTAKQLRLHILNIPTLAIDVVDIKECKENEETLSHALGLIPITYNQGTALPHTVIKYVNDCSCNGAKCIKCSVLFFCNVTCENRIVYSHDFLCKIHPASLLPNIPICRGPLVAIAYAVLGSKETKHQCTAPPPFYTHPVRVYLNSHRKLTTSQKKKLVESCPAKVFQISDIEDSGIFVNPNRECIECMECVKKGLDFRNEENEPELVRIERDVSRFHFVVECAGQLKPETILSYVLSTFF